MTGVRPYRRPVNTVFQSYALFPHLDVFENVAFGLREARVGKAEVRARVAEAISLVQLEGREQSRPRKLSGGQQQRVALARALVNRPDVLLLDEPLGALDLKLRTEMQTQLKDLQRGVGVTFCYVTHDQGEAFSMSDRVAVMNLGLLEQVGTPEDVYHRPASLFVADFVGKANRFQGRIVEGGAGVYTVGHRRHRIAPGIRAGRAPVRHRGGRRRAPREPARGAGGEPKRPHRDRRRCVLPGCGAHRPPAGRRPGRADGRRRRRRTGPGSRVDGLADLGRRPRLADLDRRCERRSR